MSKSTVTVHSFVRRTLAASVSAASLLLAAGQPAQAQEDSADALQVEEIVVTARKRDESILETPIAITAVTGADLEAKGILSFNQLADATPGINISNVASGRSDRSFQQITLRGFVPSSTNSTLTATFIDGVPVASPTALSAVNDPARVEILKGPQAAYFGRNTFAGAVNVVTKLPGEEFGGSINLMGGTRSNMDFQGSLEGPLFGDRLGFRIGARFMSKDGSYDNIARAGETLGDQETKTLTALFTAQPTENLSAKLYVMYSEDDDGPSTQGLIPAYEVRSLNGLTNIPFLTPATAGQGTLVLQSQANCTLNGWARGTGAGGDTRVARPYICGAAPDLLAINSPAQNTAETAALVALRMADPSWRVVSPSEGVTEHGLVREYWHAHLNIDWELGESGYTLSSLSGINDEYFSEIHDLDNYDTRALRNLANLTGANPNLLPFFDFVYGVERDNKDFSQELRLSFDREGPFTGLVGVSYLKTLIWNDLVNVQGEIVNGALRQQQAGKTPIETESVFFGANYQFSEQWKLSVEGRYQRDTLSFHAGATSTGTTISAAQAALFGIPAGAYPSLGKILDKEFTNFLPRVILQYDINDDLMAYASYSEGVNIGGNTINTNFINLSPLGVAAATSLGLEAINKPEKLTNYEIGLKGRFFDGRMQLQASAYMGEWADQLNFRSQFYLEANGLTQQATGYANSGTSDLQGIEVEMVAKATENLELSLAAAMTDSEIQSFATPAVSQVTGLVGDDFKGKQLWLSSKYSANAAVQYGTPVSFLDDGRWFARADLSWKDKMYADAANLTWIKARTVVNLRAGVQAGALGFDVFVNNAFDDDNYTSINQNALITPNFALFGPYGYLNVGLPELRTYGARLSYKF